MTPFIWGRGRGWNQHDLLDISFLTKIKPALAVEEQSPNHWTAKDFSSGRLIA